AVQAGAQLVVLGPNNGLARDTTHWLRGDPLGLLEPLLDALEHGPALTKPADALAAADALRGRQPVALLAHPTLIEGGRGLIERLVTALGASGATGMVGAPSLGANGAGAALLAPDLARGEASRVLASSALLALGDEAWSDLRSGSFARVILATSQPVPEDARIDIVLPMAQAYERQGSLINLEGRVQLQEGGAAPPPHARADWGIVAGIAQQLGLGPAPVSLDFVRSFIADEHPALAQTLREEVLFARV
ncbi:MAG: molybdopterin-dependent oxidoreductase, partial [Chloroflexi bacterium]|nr:molybdopterin-dependent oxidoreductase [Chloroflexota bacterium]